MRPRVANAIEKLKEAAVLLNTAAVELLLCPGYGEEASHVESLRRTAQTATADVRARASRLGDDSTNEEPPVATPDQPSDFGEGL